MKRPVIVVIVVSVLITLMSSCRDRGAYTYSGILLDSCSANPIVGAEIYVNAGMSGDQKVYTNQKGYFKATGGWNDKAAFLHKEVIPGITVYSKDGVRLLEFDYLPEGNHDLGTISVQNHLRIPYRIDTSEYACSSCELGIYLGQPQWLIFNRTTKWISPGDSITGELRFNLPLQVDSKSKSPASPLYLNVLRKDSLYHSYPDTNITSLIRFCDLSDTLVIKL